MKWTSDKPKEIGWYWNRPGKGLLPKMVFVCWRYAPNRKPQWCAIVPCYCDEWLDADSLAGEWAGPIPEPEEE